MWAETESETFVARHDARDAADAERVLTSLEAARARLEPEFDIHTPELSVVLHGSALQLDLAEPFLPLQRMRTAPAGRRYLVGWCGEHVVALVPFGGGTSVVGGLAARRDGYAGVLALDLRRLDRLVSVDTGSGTAVLEAGLLGPEVEARLGEHGRTLGHFPQSFEYA